MSVDALIEQLLFFSYRVCTHALLNWANARLTEAQIIYAANDAYAAMRVFDALGL